MTRDPAKAPNAGVVRRVSRIVGGTRVSDGAGVSIQRTIGVPPLGPIDPFLMLDHFGSENPDEYIAGFPEHPHRGFITITYMLDGHMLHKDSMGNEGHLLPGAVQWMKAASGVIHSEMPQQEHGLMRDFQLWLNLPGAHKMSHPEYQEFTPSQIPRVASDGAQIKVLSGRAFGAKGPINDPLTDLHYFDVTLEPERAFSFATAEHSVVLACVFEGGLRASDKNAKQGDLIEFVNGDLVAVTADTQGARFIVLSGRAIGEPIAQHGPFVMNTREEIIAASRDYQAGTLVRARARVVRD